MGYSVTWDETVPAGSEARSLVATATTSIIGHVAIGATQMNLYKFAAGAIDVLAGDVQANSVFAISATYFTD